MVLVDESPQAFISTQIAGLATRTETTVLDSGAMIYSACVASDQPPWG